MSSLLDDSYSALRSVQTLTLTVDEGQMQKDTGSSASLLKCILDEVFVKHANKPQ